jgi:hypothetical protein
MIVFVDTDILLGRISELHASSVVPPSKGHGISELNCVNVRLHFPSSFIPEKYSPLHNSKAPHIMDKVVALSFSYYKYT